MSEPVQEISEVLRELRNEINSLRAELRDMKANISQHGVRPRHIPWGWEGLRLEIMQVLCDAQGTRLSSKDVTDSINSKRGGKDRTSSPSVARALTELVREGSVTRILAGRERYYTLNPSRIIGISRTGSEPKKLAEEVLRDVARVPKEERTKRVCAVYYTVSGLEPFLTELDSRSEELADLVGMVPEVDIRISGVGDFHRDPKNAPSTTIRMFLIKREVPK